MRLPLLALLPLLAAGCGDKTGSVSGSVSYDGVPVKKGYVTFSPADGKGATAGGEINDGKYSVVGVPVGRTLVKVEAADKAGPSIQTTEELEKFSRENKGKIGPDGIIRTDTVPPDAEGNNQPFDVKAGGQTHDLALKKPGKK